MLSILPSARSRSAPSAGSGQPSSRRLPAPAPAALVFAALTTVVIAALPAPAALARLRHGWPHPAHSRQLTFHQALQKRHNDAALMILGGRPGAGAFDTAHDMAAALAASGGLRLIAVDASGGIESVRDLLLLRGMDLALVSGNVLDSADRQGTLGPGLRERLTYVTVLYGEEIHVLAGPGVSSLERLRGRKIAVPADDAGAEFTALDVLRRLHVEAEVVKTAAADAIDDVRSGALGALILVGGKPLRFVASLPKDGGIHLLPLPQMSDRIVGDGYSPGRLGAEDYPALLPDGQAINTVAVSAVLVARNTARSDDSNQRVTRFVPAFFGALSDLAGPRWHPKWREVNLAAPLAGWPRFPAARAWLEAAQREQSASVARDFDEFLRINAQAGKPPPSPAMRRQLFEQYLEWTRRATQAPR